MAANVGGLLIDLALDTASFRADLGRAATALNSATAQMGRSLGNLEREFSKVSRGAAAIGIGVSAAALVTFAAQSARAAGNLADLSQQLGVSTSALQAYRYGAVQAGLSTEQLEAGLATLTRKIGEAAEGSTEAVEAFRKLGVGILESGKIRSTEAVLRDVADALQRVPDNAQKAALGVDLLGKNFQKFIPLLSSGAAGLDQVSEAARKAGVVLEDSVIDRLNKGAAAFDLLTLRAKAFGATLYDSVGRATQKTVDELTTLSGLFEATLGRPSRDIGGRIRQAFGFPQAGAQAGLPPSALGDGTIGGFDNGPPRRATVTATLPLSDAEKRRNQDAQQLVRDLELERDGAGRTKAEILALKLSRELDIEATIRQGVEVRKYTAAQVEAAVVIQKQIDLSGIRRQAAEAAAAADEMAAQDMLGAQEALNRQQKAIADELQGAENLKEQAAAGKLATVEWDNLSQAYRVNARELDIIIEKQRILAQDSAVSADKARELATIRVDATEELRKSTAAQEGQVRRLNDAARSMGQAVGTAFEDAILSGKKFSDVLRGLLQDIARIILRLTVTKQLEASIAGALGGGGFLSGLFGTKTFAVAGGGIGTTGGGISTFTGSGGTVAAGLGGFAEGGRPPVGVPSFVGERGKEIFVPDQAGTILPADVTSRLMNSGGSGTTVYADMRGASVDAVQRLERFLVSINASIEPRSVAAWRDAMGRGGRAARA